MKNKQIFMRFKDNKLVIDDTIKNKFAQAEFLKGHTDDDYHGHDDLIISFMKQKTDIGIYFWFGDYSIGFSRTELLKVLKVIEDKDKLTGLLVAASI